VKKRSVNRLSDRTAWDPSANALASRLEALRAVGAPLLDLTESNPTACGLAWPAGELAALLTQPGGDRYLPDPMGRPEARAAVAAYLAARGARVPDERVLLTASTSEAYGFLMKLLCDPGDAWLVPAPSYPLLDLLARLELVELARYPLRYDGEWIIDREALVRAITPRTRAVVVVSPGNPTGAVASADELRFLERLCAERGLALVSDEVFADTAAGAAPSAAACTDCLAFQLAGLSKVCGLPQLKAGWIAVAGPAAQVAPALSRLEVISDTYLSVSGAAQQALPALLDRRETFLRPLRARLAQNREAAHRGAGPGAAWGVLGGGAGGGGWSAVIRVGERIDEEALCLRLLDAGLVVQPGFFYDFERNGHLVISLLPDPAVFRMGITRLAALL
jgi:aspartate/methionine/tyrosine aminotransferase